MPRCAIIIPVRHHTPFTARRVDAVLETLLPEDDVEIVLVDLGPHGHTAALRARDATRIRIVRGDAAMGLATARNAGVAGASGEQFILLDGDLLPRPDWFRALIAYAVAHPSAAVVASKLVAADDTVRHAGIVVGQDGLPRRLYAGFPADHPAVNKSRPFRMVSALGALFRRAPFEQVGGFDAAFVDASMDLDLCLRLGERGHAVHLCHESILLHPAPTAAETGGDDADPGARLYRERWADRVRPDDLRYYIEDGLLHVDYPPLSPPRFTVAPPLGIVPRDPQDETADRLLDRRAAQVLALLKENARLKRDVHDAGLDTIEEHLATFHGATFRAFVATRRTLSFPRVDRPLVSVIVPAYARARSIYATLASMHAADDARMCEVIVVGDDSLDMACVADRLAHVRTQVFPQEIAWSEACNRAAALARGTVLCFLPSGTLVTPGWMHALLDVLARYPRCGTVAAKLIHPGGALEDAGCIIWRDGAIAGYGRADDPFAPEYSYSREVDAGSLPCLTIRAALFRSLGGFATDYTLACHQAADLAMRVRQAGSTVMYAPRAIVFPSAEALDRGGAEMTSEADRVAFAARWGKTLRGHGQHSPARTLRRRDRRRGARVLVIDDCVPVPQFGRGLLRARALLLALNRAGYVVSFLPGQDPAAHEPATSDLQRLGIEVLYHVDDARTTLEERRGLYDVVVVCRPHHANLIDAARRWNPNATIIYDTEALFTIREIQRAAVVGAPLSAHEVASRMRSELAGAASADLVLTVTEAEQQMIQRYYPHLPIRVWGDALAAHTPEADFATRRDLLFIGYLGSEPNDDAVRYLIEQILPEFRTRVDCRITVVGIDATPAAAAAAATLPGVVTFTGAADDLTPVYDAHRVFVAPHRFAAGMPHKVIEAMAYGIPCVVSTLLGMQLGITDGDEALVADDARDFIDKTERLYRDAGLWQRIQDRARRQVQARYDPTAMQAALQRYIDEATARRQM